MEKEFWQAKTPTTQDGTFYIFIAFITSPFIFLIIFLATGMIDLDAASRPIGMQ